VGHAVRIRVDEAVDEISGLTSSTLSIDDPAHGPMQQLGSKCRAKALLASVAFGGRPMKTFVVAVLASLVGLGGCGPGGGGSPDGPLPDVAIIVGDMGGDGGIPCGYPQTPPPGFKNDPACPATYGGHLFTLCTPPNQPCTPNGLMCSYFGVGDGVPGCQAIAMMWCRPLSGGSDGGTGWVCAN
jgi:hypothetical protein